jgi:hypothetical protein
VHDRNRPIAHVGAQTEAAPVRGPHRAVSLNAYGVIQPEWIGPFRVVMNAARGSSRYAVAIYE